jgi:hypothetical protein
MANVVERIEKTVVAKPLRARLRTKPSSFSNAARPNIQSNYAAPVKG